MKHMNGQLKTAGIKQYISLKTLSLLSYSPSVFGMLVSEYIQGCLKHHVTGLDGKLKDQQSYDTVVHPEEKHCSCVCVTLKEKSGGQQSLRASSPGNNEYPCNSSAIKQ